MFLRRSLLSFTIVKCLPTSDEQCFLVVGAFIFTLILPKLERASTTGNKQQYGQSL